MTYTATVGFWMIFPKGKDPIILPSLIVSERIKDRQVIESLMLTDVWNATVPVPDDIDEGTPMAMIPVILSLEKLVEDPEKLATLYEIKTVKEKCKELTNQYLKN